MRGLDVYKQHLIERSSHAIICVIYQVLQMHDCALGMDAESLLRNNVVELAGDNGMHVDQADTPGCFPAGSTRPHDTEDPSHVTNRP